MQGFVLRQYFFSVVKENIFSSTVSKIFKVQSDALNLSYRKKSFENVLSEF